jgi:cytochrome c oxidase subunit 2
VRTTALAAVGGVVSVAATGCASEDLPTFAVGETATSQADTMLSLWQGSWIAAFAVGALVWGLILWAVIFHRKKSDQAPEQTRYNIPIEVLYTVVPVLVIGVLFFFTARDEHRLTQLSDNPDHTVNVVGFRWNWAFNYVDEDVYEVGTPDEFPTLYLPVDQTIRFQLTSPDTIHSFWVPAFLFKMDNIPGRLNEFEITPTKEGRFAGRCAELCGVDHSRMLFWVEVVSQDEFDDQIAELEDRGQTGLLDTDRASEAATDGQGVTQIGGRS